MNFGEAHVVDPLRALFRQFVRLTGLDRARQIFTERRVEPVKQRPFFAEDTFEPAAPGAITAASNGPQRSGAEAFRADTFTGFSDGFETSASAPVDLSGGVKLALPLPAELPRPVAIVANGFSASIDDLVGELDAPGEPAATALGAGQPEALPFISPVAAELAPSRTSELDATASIVEAHTTDSELRAATPDASAVTTPGLGGVRDTARTLDASVVIPSTLEDVRADASPDGVLTDTPETSAVAPSATGDVRASPPHLLAIAVDDRSPGASVVAPLTDSGGEALLAVAAGAHTADASMGAIGHADERRDALTGAAVPPAGELPFEASASASDAAAPSSQEQSVAAGSPHVVATTEPVASNDVPDLIELADALSGR